LHGHNVSDFLLRNVQCNIDRRRCLKQSLALALPAIAGCGRYRNGFAPIGVASAAPLSTAPPRSRKSGDGWAPAVPMLMVGSMATFDLNTTLPSGVIRGGTFGIDLSGAALPEGMNLNPDGRLAVGTATVGTVRGVLFTYEEP